MEIKRKEDPSSALILPIFRGWSEVSKGDLAGMASEVRREENQGGAI